MYAPRTLPPYPMVNSVNDSGSVNSEVSHKLVDDLKLTAREGDGKAVELLVELAVAGRIYGGQTSGMATQALLELSTDPKTDDQFWPCIQKLSFENFEKTQNELTYKIAGSRSKPEPLEVPTPLLPIALHHAEKYSYSATASAIGSTLATSVNLGDAPSVMKSANRFCSAEEILSPLNQADQSKQFGAALVIEALPLIASEKDFDGRFSVLAQNALKSAKLHAALIQIDNHWVVAVVGPTEDGQLSNKVQVIVYDTLHGLGDPGINGLGRKIASALGGLLCDKPYLAGANVQGNTNGCGPLCMNALRGLRQHLEDLKCLARMSQVWDFLSGQIDNMRKWPECKLEGIVAGLRGQMLEATESVIKETGCRSQRTRPSGQQSEVEAGSLSARTVKIAENPNSKIVAVDVPDNDSRDKKSSSTRQSSPQPVSKGSQPVSSHIEHPRSAPIRYKVVPLSKSNLSSLSVRSANNSDKSKGDSAEQRDSNNRSSEKAASPSHSRSRGSSAVSDSAFQLSSIADCGFRAFFACF